MFQASVSVIMALLMGLIGVGFVIWHTKKVLSYDAGSQVMQDIALALQGGASELLRRE